MTDTVQISAQAVNDLRTRTGAGLMACKQALVQAKGDAEKAIDILRASGQASAAKKAGREARDGLVSTALNADQTEGAMVQVSCETDFVAKTDAFKDFGKALAEHVLSHKEVDPAKLETQIFKPTGQTIKESITGLVAKLGEHMTIRRSARHEANFVEQYIHIGGKVGIMISLSVGNPATAKNPAVKSLAKDIAMHIAASSPVGISRNEIPADIIAKEKEIAAEQAKGKPAAAAEKIISGKLEKFYAQNCLLEQPFVKNPDVAIKALVETTAKQLGDTITVRAFSRFQVGT